MQVKCPIRLILPGFITPNNDPVQFTIFKLLIMQISISSITYKCMTCVCVFVCVFVCVCHLIVQCKVQSFVSDMLTLLGQFPIMLFVADINISEVDCFNCG